jgi:hypothetical protein
MFDTLRLRELVGAMLSGLADRKIDPRLLPSSSAASEIGDFQANRMWLREILTRGRHL